VRDDTSQAIQKSDCFTGSLPFSFRKSLHHLAHPVTEEQGESVFFETGLDSFAHPSIIEAIHGLWHIAEDAY
jgi:hypothetical protein